jgi:hypothetical protein
MTTLETLRSELVDLILEGSAVLGELQGEYFNTNMTAACAIGCAAYAAKTTPGYIEDKFRPVWLRYYNHYGRSIAMDNDTFGRNQALLNLKELPLDEQ